MEEEQIIKVRFVADTSELDEVQEKAEKIVKTLERVNETGKIIANLREKDPFYGMVFQGPPVSKEQYIKAYEGYVRRCSN